MDSRATFVAHRHFPGPSIEPEEPTPPAADMIHSGGSSPAVYRVDGLTPTDWKNIWCWISAARRFCLAASPPRLGTQGALIVFDAGDGQAPLCLTCELEQQLPGQLWLTTDSPPLSWRLAAVDFARRIAGKPTATRPSAPAPAALGDLTDRPLRLRWDVGGPATTVGPTDELAHLVVALRSGHRDLDDLLDETGVGPAVGMPFVASLVETGVVEAAPKPLESMDSAFDHLAMHWSAYDGIVDRNHRALRRKLQREGDKPALQVLENAYEMVNNHRQRRVLRHAMIPPPVISEVVVYLRSRLEVAILEKHTDRAIDLGRRILELDPTDHRVAEVLNSLTE